jgi:hypothetical protein
LAAVRNPSPPIQHSLDLRFFLLLKQNHFLGFSYTYTDVFILAFTVAKNIFGCDLCKIAILDASVVG